MTEEEYLRMMEAANSPRSGMLGGNINVPAFPSLTPEQQAMASQPAMRSRGQGIVGAIGGLLGNLGRAVGPGLQQASRAIYGDDEITRLRRQNAFQAMTLNPNQALITSNAAQIQRLQDQELLNQMGMVGAEQIRDPRLKALVQQGVITAKDALTIEYRAPSQIEQMMQLYQRDPNAFREYAEAGMFGAQPGGQSPYETQAAGSLNTAFDTLNANAVASRAMINDLQRFVRAVGDMPTGPGTKTAATILEVAERFGLPIDEDMLAKAQTIEAAAGNMVAQQLRLNKGPQTDFDARFQATIMPNLGTTTQANNEIDKYLTSKNQIEISLGNIANSSRTYNFDQDKELYRDVQEYATNIPAAIDDESGNWEYFSEFRLKYMAQNRSATEQDVFNAWKEKSDRAQNIEMQPFPTPAPTANLGDIQKQIDEELRRRGL